MKGPGINEQGRTVTEPKAQYEQAQPWRLGCAILALVLVLLVAVPIAYIGYHYGLRHLPTLFTEPMKSDTADELCLLLDLTEDPRCAGNSAHAFEFLPELLAQYPKGTAGETVDSDLGHFADYCTEWITRGEYGDYQDCQYSLDGDRHLMLYITQRKETGAPAGTATVTRTCSFDVGNGSLWDIYACDPPLSTGLLLVMSDNTFLSAPGFSVAFLIFDVLIVSLVVVLRRPLGIGD
jgi:hypothetical protein